MNLFSKTSNLKLWISLQLKVFKSQTLCRNAIVALLHFDSDGEAWFRWRRERNKTEMPGCETRTLKRSLIWSRWYRVVVWSRTQRWMRAPTWKTTASLLQCKAEHGGLMSIDTTVRLESGQEAPLCSIAGEWRPHSGGRSSRSSKRETQRWDSRRT